MPLPMYFINFCFVFFHILYLLILQPNQYKTFSTEKEKDDKKEGKKIKADRLTEEDTRRKRQQVHFKGKEEKEDA